MKAEKLYVFLSSGVLLAAIVVSSILGDTVHIIITAILLLLLVSIAAMRLLDRLFLFLLPFMASVYVVGSMLNLFKSFYFFDVLVHFVAAFVITLLIASVLRVTAFQQLAKHKALCILLIACIGIAIGAWWEVFEWFAGTYIQHGLIRGPADTALDLVVDSIGAFTAGWVGISLFFKK